MTFRFTFSDLRDRYEIKKLVDFLHKQDLGYPNYDNWVGRTENELDIGYKKAIIAISERRIVGNLVYQTHKGLSQLLEIKNLRVHKDFRMRDFARFMLKQLEVEAQEFYRGIIGDVREDQYETLRFMTSCGYKPIITAQLYNEKSDITLIKPIRKDLSLFLPEIKKVVIRRIL